MKELKVISLENGVILSENLVKGSILPRTSAELERDALLIFLCHGSKENEIVMNEQTARMGVNDWKVRQNVQQASMPAMTQEDKQRIGKHLEREIQRLGSSEHEKRAFLHPPINTCSI